MPNMGDIISKVAAFGVGGWFAENAICGTERYSTLLRSTQIPFLPVYAANGVVLTAASEYVSRWPWLARGLVYAVLGSGVEWVGCQIDKHLLNNSAQLMYNNPDALARLTSGCVNFKRGAMWGGMGLIAERVA
jgi:hypothetical protein